MSSDGGVASSGRMSNGDSGLRGMEGFVIRPREHHPCVPQWATTLLAVVAGGAVTYFGQLLIEARRAKTAEAVERRSAEAELRTAKRLTMDELETIHLHQQLILNEGRYPSNRDVLDRLLPTSDWETYRGVLARELEDDHWASLARMMHSVASQRATVAGGTEGGRISDDVREGLRSGAELSADIYTQIVGRPPLSA